MVNGEFYIMYIYQNLKNKNYKYKKNPHSNTAA